MTSLNSTWFLPPIQARAKLALCVVILLDLMATGLVAWQISAHRDYPFDGDEAAHANGGLILALDLRASDLKAFAVDSYQQDMYPPAFSWLETLVFLIFGASPISARMCSLACLFLAALVLYAISLELDEKLGWLVGLVTVSLTLTSQTILANAGLVMLETPGLLVSFLTLWAYLRALKQPTRRRLASVSLLAALTVLTKYPYGIIVVPTLVIVELLAILPHPIIFRSARTLERWLWLFGPLTLILLAWFAQPYKVAAFIRYATSQPEMVALFSLENLVYYPRSIALHYAPSPLWGLLTLAGLIWAVWHWRDKRLLVFLIYFGLGLLIMTIKLQKQPRFIATIVPAAHLMTGAMLAWLASRRSEGWACRKPLTFATAVILSLCIITAAPVLFERFTTFPLWMQIEYETDSRANDMVAWIASQVPIGQRIYLINPWDQFSTLATEWYLATHHISPGVHSIDIRVPSKILLKEAEPENVEKVERAIRASHARYVAVLEGGPEGRWQDYAEQMTGVLIPVARREFEIRQWKSDLVLHFNRSLLTRRELERVASDSYSTLHIRVSVYSLRES